MSADPTITTRWYTQFWAWFVIGLLAVSVILSLTMLTVALKNPENLVVTNYYEVGKGINRSLEREKRAQQLGIKAQLELDTQLGQAHLKLEGQTLPQQLLLNLISPTQPERDLKIILQHKEANLYQGYLPEGAQNTFTGRRFVELLGTEQQQEWRLYVEENIEANQVLELIPE